MSARVRWSSIASLAVFAVAAPCLAADAVTPTGMAPGRGGIGGHVGGSYFYLDQDYSAGAQPRFAFAGTFRYVVSHSWRLQMAPGFTWAAYTNREPVPFTDPNFPADVSKVDYLAQVVPTSLQIQWLLHSKAWHYHIGAGPGFYRVWVENHRKVLKDPDTNKLHRGVYFGGTAEIGVERFLKALPSTGVELTTATHFVSAQRDDQFPNGYNSSVGVVELRLGVNYYFDLHHEKSKPTETVPPATP